MKNDLTEIVFILDKSGSMAGLEKDTIGGFNAMIEKQKRESGRALVSTVLFNQKFDVIHDRIDIHEVPKMDEQQYQVSGCTALLDAVGGAIRHINNIHRYGRKEDIPAHTIFVITTDGMENASIRYTREAVRSMIAARKEKGWQFLFLAANIDAVETASWYGIDEDHAVKYCSDSDGIALNSMCISDAIASVRHGNKLSAEWKTRIVEDYEKRKD